VPGYIADLVVVDKDLLRIDPQQLGTAKVLRTVVDGKERFVAGSTG
jgi:predicted amidohydrolase YtcJ